MTVYNPPMERPGGMLAAAALAAVVLILTATFPAAAEAPLWTRDPMVLRSGEGEWRLGGAYVWVGKGAQRYRLPVGELRCGLGGVAEAFAVLDFGEAIRSGEGGAWDVEHFSVGTKILLHDRQGDGWPDAGVAFEVSVPSSHATRGVGVDATDFHARLLLGEDYGKTRAVVNLGVGILEKTNRLWGQDDSFEYGVSLTHPAGPHGELMAEVRGHTYTDRRPGELFGLAGYRHRLPGGDRWDLYLIAGLDDQAENLEAGFGYTFAFPMYHRREGVEAEDAPSPVEQMEELLAGELAHLNEGDKEALRKFARGLEECGG
jgi:hypothetical protein